MMETKVSKQNLHYINVLNVLACLCVVGLHCNGAVHAPTNQSYWYQSLIVKLTQKIPWIGKYIFP